MIINETLIDNNNYKVASAGIGYWTEIPWIDVFDREITESAQKGYYVVYLFREDMSGVYLSLDFFEKYDKEYIEAHHVIPVSEMPDGLKTNPSAVVFSYKSFSEKSLFSIHVSASGNASFLKQILQVICFPMKVLFYLTFPFQETHC